MKNGMTNAFVLFSIILVIIGCASRGAQTDPEAVVKQIEALKEQERALVRELVSDNDRASALLSLLNDIDMLVEKQTAMVVSYGQSLQALNAKYDATPEEFSSLFAKYNDGRSNYQKEFVTLLASMKQQTTDSEWKKISKFQLKNMNPREAVYSDGAQ